MKTHLSSSGRIHHVWSLILALQISPVVAIAQPLTIDFEGLPSMPFSPQSPIPQQSRLSSQLLSAFGVSFSSGSPYVAVVNIGLGHATSGVNGITGTTTGGLLTGDAAFPIVATFFDPAAPLTPAVTDFVAASIDRAGTSGLTVSLNAFDINGSLIGSVTLPDLSGARLEVSVPGIHSVQYVGTLDYGAAVLDDFTFDPLTPVPEPSCLALDCVTLAILSFRQSQRKSRLSKGYPSEMVGITVRVGRHVTDNQRNAPS